MVTTVIFSGSSLLLALVYAPELYHNLRTMLQEVIAPFLYSSSRDSSQSLREPSAGTVPAANGGHGSVNGTGSQASSFVEVLYEDRSISVVESSRNVRFSSTAGELFGLNSSSRRSVSYSQSYSLNSESCGGEKAPDTPSKGRTRSMKQLTNQFSK